MLKQLVPTPVRAAFTNLVAGVDRRAMPRWKALLTRSLRIGIFVLRDLRRGELGMQATSLVYTTLLSLVPLLAVVFWVLQAFGVHNRMEPLLLRLMEPLGEQGAELTHQVVTSVENVEAGVLGSVGVLLLVWSALSLIQKIERAFDQIWQLAPRRRIALRFGTYLSVVLIGPVLIFSLLAMVTSALDHETIARLLGVPAVGALVAALEGALKYVAIVAVLLLVYLLVPNTRVRLVSALAGAVVAAILWQGVGWAFATFTVTSARYATIYSGFAILLLLIIWVYLSWLILLLGASVAFYHQYPEFLGLERRGLRLSNRMREKLALLTMLHVGRSRRFGRPPWNARRLARELRVPLDAISRILDALVGADLLERPRRADGDYQTAKELAKIPLWDVLGAVRTSDEAGVLNNARVASEPVVDDLMSSILGAVERRLVARSVLDLVLEEAPVESPRGEPENQHATGDS